MDRRQTSRRRRGDSRLAGEHRWRLSNPLTTITTARPSIRPLIDAAADCVKTGEACVAHCVTVLSEGEKEMAACQATVLETLAICAALQQLANLNSPHLAKVAAVARDICKDCETECRKHESKHSICKDCGDACAACAKQCETVTA